MAMQGKPRVKLLTAGAAVVMLMLSFQNCGGMNSMYQAEQDSMASLSSTSIPNSPNIGKFSMTSIAAQTSNLGKSFTVPFMVSGDSIFNGAVALSVRASDLYSVDTAQVIKFALDKSSVMLAPGSSQTVNLTVTVPTLAPSFANVSVHVDGVDATGAVKSSTIVPLTVKAIYDVNIHAGTSTSLEDWGLAVGSVTQFIAHTEGLQVRFNNYDTQNNIVHSTGGPIAHEDQTNNYPGTTAPGMPMSPNGGTSAGGQYVQTVAAGAMDTSGVYSHNHESGSRSRTLQFNVAVRPVPTPTPGANAATFTQVKADILTSKCIGCHSGANPAGGLNFSTYAGVASVVTAGNSSVSTIYLAVSGSNPAMPQGGTPLTAAQLAELAAWINAGAMNN